jgi:antirestriction protein
MAASKNGDNAMSGTDLRVYIACLACYNDGYHVGEWYDADEAGDVTVEQIHADGGAPENPWLSEHEELMVHDHEGFGKLLTGECSPYEAQRIAELIADLDDDMRDAIGVYLEERGDHLDDQTLDRCRDAYHGKYDDEKDFAMRWAEDTDAINNHISWPYNCIDWKAATEELFNGGFYTLKAADGGIHVFCGN